MLPTSEFTSIACESAAALDLSSFIWKSMSKPNVKFKPWPCFMENLSNCKASISSGLMQLHWAVIVSFAEEKTLSHGTAEPWIGKISIARAKIVGKHDWFSCNKIWYQYDFESQLQILSLIPANNSEYWSQFGNHWDKSQSQSPRCSIEGRSKSSQVQGWY